MRLLFYLFILSQFFNVIGIFAEKVNKESLVSDLIKWERIQENNSKNNIWKYYYDSTSNYENNNLENNSKKNFSNTQNKKINFINNKKEIQKLFQIQPHIPLNNFLNSGEFSLSTYWISSFGAGAAGGTGQQNYAFKFDYGLSDESLFSIYLSETDDPLYKLIDGEIIPNNWTSVSMGLKKKLFQSENFKNSLSFVGFLEYWVISSGSNGSPGGDPKKSIYNEINNDTGIGRYEKFIYSFSLPFTKELNSKTKFIIVPGGTLIPNILGDKNIGENFYGSNYFLASGLTFDIATNVKLIGSYTYLFGPGHNSFDEFLNYHRVPIYSYGVKWNINQIISIEGRISNSFGSTPSTALLTIPSDNKPLYYLSGSFNPFLDDTKFTPLDKNDNLLLFGGLTVDNAVFPERGISQISFNYDDQGNLFANYGYSLSNIFQLELEIGSFNNINLIRTSNSILQDIFLSNNNLNYRFGGKILIFSPQKNDPFWLVLRTSAGRNNQGKQGYLFSEFISTFRLNDRVAFNISPKYFFSGVKSFGSLGVSSYINLLDNLMLIPEMNTSFKNDSDFNSSLALRYSLNENKSVDLYYSNAAGIQDIGQLFEDNKNRFGIKLNFLF